jgi:hypothetical protein
LFNSEIKSRCLTMSNYNVVIVYKYESYYLNSKLPDGKYSTSYRKIAIWGVATGVNRSAAPTNN